MAQVHRQHATAHQLCAGVSRVMVQARNEDAHPECVCARACVCVCACVRACMCAFVRVQLRKAEPPTGQTAAEGDTAFLLNSEAFRDLKTRVRKAIPQQVFPLATASVCHVMCVSVRVCVRVCACMWHAMTRIISTP